MFFYNVSLAKTPNVDLRSLVDLKPIVDLRKENLSHIVDFSPIHSAGCAKIKRAKLKLRENKTRAKFEHIKVYDFPLMSLVSKMGWMTSQ